MQVPFVKLDFHLDMESPHNTWECHVVYNIATTMILFLNFQIAILFSVFYVTIFIYTYNAYFVKW